MDRYHVFSSEDMVNWLDEGEILAQTMSPGVDLREVSCGHLIVRTRTGPITSTIHILAGQIGTIRGKLELRQAKNLLAAL